MGWQYERWGDLPPPGATAGKLVIRCRVTGGEIQRRSVKQSAFADLKTTATKH
jgi:hypothetical protein